MGSSEVLGTYLNDHLGGANAGVEMARRLRDRAQDGPDEAELNRLCAEIEQDREELKALIDTLGEVGHPIKEVAGWVAGKVHRLGVATAITGDAQLSMLLETEALALGIDGKHALWHALVKVQHLYPQLGGIDLARLIERAAEQRKRIETIRLDAALQSFATHPDPRPESTGQ